MPIELTQSNSSSSSIDILSNQSSPAIIPAPDQPQKQRKSPKARNFKKIQFYSLSTEFMQGLAEKVGQTYNPATGDPTQVLIAINPPDGKCHYDCLTKNIDKKIQTDSDYKSYNREQIVRGLRHHPFYAILVKKDFFEKYYQESPKNISIDNPIAKEIREEIINSAKFKLRGIKGVKEKCRENIYTAINNFVANISRKNSLENQVPSLAISHMMPAPTMPFAMLEPNANNVDPLIYFDGERLHIDTSRGPWAIGIGSSLIPIFSSIKSANAAPFQFNSIPSTNQPGFVVPLVTSEFPVPIETIENNEEINKLQVAPGSVHAIPSIATVTRTVDNEESIASKTAIENSVHEKIARKPAGTTVFFKETNGRIINEITASDSEKVNNNNNTTLKRKELETQANSVTKKSKTTVVDEKALFGNFNSRVSSADQHLTVYKSCYQQAFVKHQILANLKQKHGVYIITTLMQAVIENNKADFDIELERIQQDEDLAVLNLPVLESRSNQQIDLVPLNNQLISVLSIACSLGRADMAIKLLKAGTNDYKPSLINAIQYAHVGMMRFMFSICKKVNITNPASVLQTEDLQLIFNRISANKISQVVFTLCQLGFFADENRLMTVATILAQRSDFVGLDKLIGSKHNLTSFFSMPKEQRSAIRTAYNKLSVAIEKNTQIDCAEVLVSLRKQCN